MLPFKRFYRSGNYVYSHGYEEKNDDFVWFLEDNSFALSKGIYLYNSHVTWHDPFASYWMRKYRRWFKENVNTDYLPEYYNSSITLNGIKTEREFSSASVYDAYLRRYYAGIALKTLVTKDAPTKEIVEQVMDIANKLVAELRFKEKKEQEKQQQGDGARVA